MTAPVSPPPVDVGNNANQGGGGGDGVALVWLAGAWAGCLVGSLAATADLAPGFITDAAGGWGHLLPVPILIPLLVRRRLVAVVPLALTAALLMVGAENTYDRLAAPDSLDGRRAVVVGDPSPLGPGSTGSSIRIRLDDGRRVEAVGYGPVGFTIASLEPGTAVALTGSLRPRPERAWLRYGHVVGSVSASSIEVVDSPSWWMTPPRLLRSAVVDGADPLPPDLRALYTGLVIGDDRFQSPAQQARFRLAGLTHLLAVSGQNVAFVLVAAGPLLRAMPRTARLVATASVLVVFAVVTRAEPSVLRATATAGVAAWAATTGRTRSGVQVLAVAATGLLLVDPFLSRVVGFQLSVAASLGILILGPVVERRLPGPALVRAPLAVTAAAQLGVAPLLIALFGPLSLISLPANLAVGWAAGAVMTLGLTAGPLAALTVGPLSTVLQAPSLVLLHWIDLVARWAAMVPAPRVGGGELALVVIGAAGIRLAPARAVRLVLLALLAVGLVRAVPPPATGLDPITVAAGARFWPAGPGHGSVLVLDPEAGTSVVDGLLLRRVGHVDLVVTRSGSRRAGAVVASVLEVASVGEVLAPPDHLVKGATRLMAARVVPVGRGVMVVEPESDGSTIVLRSSSG